MARIRLAPIARAAGIALGIASAALAQPAPEAAQPAKGRPRVGLVLSGGGARGIAHIGVLRVLEQHRVPVDLITGTSMGSIIGGLYAAGYSPDEMEKIVDEIDWQDSFDDAPPRAHRSFRRKEDDRNFLTSLKLGIKKGGGIALPWGLVQGQKLNLILRRLFMPVAEIHDFDQLHVPFRAVSTDVVTGKPEVHASGDLATAVRASMSLPGVFAPVEEGGKLLVDGGISNNTPVDLALGMGADILIVVDVGTPLDSRDEITNGAAVVGQLISLMVVSTTERQLALMRPGDILIRPDLEGVSTASFSMGSTVAPRGVDAANAQVAALDRLAVSEQEYAALLEAQRHGASQPLMIDKVRIANDSRLRNEVLQARLETKAGEPLDVARLEADVQEIYGIDAFERVDYRIASTSGGNELDIVASEKSWGPRYLRFGLNLEENFENVHNYNLAFNFTVQPINGLGGEWRTDAQLGNTLRLFTEFWQPFDAESKWFAAPSFELKREPFPVYSGDRQVADVLVRTTNFGFDLGRELSNWGEMRVGLVYDLGHARTIIGATPAPGQFRSGGFYTRFAVDTLDNVHFPRSGGYAGGVFGLIRESLGADASYELMYALAGHTFTFGENTLLAVVSGQTIWGSSGTITDLAHLGGFQRLSGFDRYQLAGRHSLLARVSAYRRVAVPGALSFSYPVYAGFSVEGGNVSQARDDLLDDVIAAGSVFVGMETPLGPLYFGYGHAEGDHGSFYLYLGRTF